MKIQYSAKEQNLDTTAIASACLGSFSWVAGITLNYKFDEGSNSLCRPLIMLTLSRCSINIPTLSVNWHVSAMILNTHRNIVKGPFAGLGGIRFARPPGAFCIRISLKITGFGCSFLVRWSFCFQLSQLLTSLLTYFPSWPPLCFVCSESRLCLWDRKLFPLLKPPQTHPANASSPASALVLIAVLSMPTQQQPLIKPRLARLTAHVCQNIGPSVQLSSEPIGGITITNSSLFSNGLWFKSLFVS